MRLHTRLLFLFCVPFLLLFSSIHNVLNAQLTPSYKFTSSNGTYTAITGGTLIDTGSSIGNQRYPVTLPFTFMMDDSLYTQAMINANGFLSLGTGDPGAGNYAPIANSPSGYTVVSAFGRDLNSLNNTTAIRAQTFGTAPYRRYVIQWGNFSYGSSSGITMNFQVVLYETYNKIDIVYGGNATSLNTITGQVGLRGSLINSNFFARSGTAGWSSTTAATANTATVTLSPTYTPSSGLTYTFEPPDSCIVPLASATGLLFSAGYTSVTGSFTGAGAGIRYLVVRTPGSAPLNTLPINGGHYTTGSSIGNGTVIYRGTLTSFSNTGLPQNATYTYTIFPCTDSACSYGPMYQTASPLSGTVQTYGPKRYVWVPATGSASYMTAANWNPQRLNADVGDTLVFNNGGTDTITNVPVQNLAGIQVLNNTTAVFTNASSDSLTLSTYLGIAAGSTLTLAGANPMKLKWATSGARTANIYGTFNLLGSTAAFDAKSGATTVWGIVNVAGNAASFNTACTTCVSEITFAAGSFYNHMMNGGTIPFATWSPLSTLNVTGTTNTAPVFPSSWASPYNLGNIIINTPAATVAMGGGTGIDTVKGAFTIKNTGTGSFEIINCVVTGVFTLSKGKMSVIGGNGVIFNNDVILDTGRLDIIGTVFINGDITQTAADSIVDGGTSLWFIGVRHQNISIGGAFVVAPYANTSYYGLQNPSGATLTGIIPVNQYSQVRILSGAFSGSGAFSYAATGAVLNYEGASSQTVSPVEWPVLNSPPKVNVNITGLSPYNRLYLTGSRTIAASLGINGVIVLGNNDLSIASSSTNAINTATTPGAMIVTNGTGRFIRAVGAAGAYNFPVGDMMGTDKASPLLLTVSSNAATRSIGVNVQPAKHPNDTSSTNYLTRYWKLTDNGGTAACTYTATFTYNAGDVAGAATFSPNSWNGTAWSVLPGSANAVSNTLNITTPLTSPAYSLNTEITGRGVAATASATTYTWTGAVSKVWTVAGNWNPSRVTPATSDILQFSDGLTDSVTNMPSETIRRLAVSNGTTLRLINTGAPVLNILADASAATDELSVNAGSALYFHNTQSAAIAFSGVGATATIAGRLEIVSTSGTGAGNTINLSNCVTTVPATGVLAAGTTDNGNPFSSTAATLSIAGTYEHKYTTVKGYIPTATWLPGSQVLMKGITSIAATQSAPNGIRQSFYDFTYNCPSQTGTLSWGSILPDSVRGTFRMISSGAASLTMGSISSYKTCVNKFIQTGGTFNFGTGGASVFRVLDSFVQTGGTLLAPTPSSSGVAELHFGGISGPQTVIFNGAAPAGGLDYKISNPYGINLSGTGGMSIFTINSASSLIIATAAATPVNTGLSLQYGTNTTLVYDSSDMAAGTGGITATALTFPATAGPAHLTVNTGNRDVTFPFTRTVPGTLKMLTGNISMGSDTLTLGSGSTNATSGTLTYTSGVINVTTGSFRRWMSASSSSTAAILFPLGANGAVRTLSIIPPASGTAWSAGGTLTATHNGAAGLATGINVADGSYTIRSRTNASWHITPAAGITPATGAAFSLRLTSGSVYPWYSAINLHVMCSNSVTGTHTAGFGNLPDMVAVRSGLSFANLTDSTFYVGTDTTNTPNVFNSIKTGSWSSAGTWDRNAVPGISDFVYVSAGDTVSVTSAGAAKWLTVKAGGVLMTGAAAFTVDSVIQNNGSFLMSGSSVTLGPAGGGPAPFISNGTLSVSGGTLNVNGYLQLSSGSAFNQTAAGIINIDGNGGSTNPSVPMPYPFFNIDPNVAINAPAGTINIIDPHWDNVYSNSYVFAASGGGGFGPAHNLILGDGFSTTSGGISSFRFGAPAFTIGNLIIKGSPSGSNRRASAVGQINIGGNLELHNQNALLYSSDIYLKGNLVVDTLTTFSTWGKLYFGDYNGGTPVAATAPQTVSGSGVIQNHPITPTANFQDLSINNSSPAGVSFSIGNTSYSSSLTFIRGILNVGTGNTVTARSGSAVTASAATGWVVGGFTNEYLPTSYTNTLYPLGDVTNYTPVYMRGSYPISQGGFVSVGIVPGDHPALSGSAINPVKSVNRYYNISAGGGITFNNNPLYFKLGWGLADMDAGANPTAFMVGAYNGSAWSTPSSSVSIGSNFHEFLVPDPNNFNASYAVGEAGSAPIIVVAPAAQTICSGAGASFSVNASGATAYHWQVNSGSGWSMVANSALYSGASTQTLSISSVAAGMNGWLYRAIAYNNYDSAISTSAVLNAGTTVAPTVTISAAPGNVICAGTPVIFSAALTNGGSMPAYQWMKNSITVGTSTIYTDNALAAGDVISCSIVSSSACASPLTAVSNSITMTVNPTVTPTITISSSAGTTICAGTSVTLTATVTNAGSSPAFIWKKNVVNVGANSPTYTDASLANGDGITCTVASSAACVTNNSATTPLMFFTVNPTLTPAITIAATGGTTICAGAPVTFTSTITNGGTTPQYLWRKNGVSTGVTTATYTSSALAAGDVISCVLTSNASCLAKPTDTSNALIMTVNTPAVPGVTIGAAPGNTVCSGTPVTFTAAPLNGGTTPLYQWYKNSVLISGATSATYSSSSLASGDIISCVLTTSLSCVTKAKDTSAGIVMNVTATLTPAATVSVTPTTTICSGSTAAFNVTTNVTGGIYQWQVNNVNAGTNSSTYSYAPANGDAVKCIVTTPAGTCFTSSSVTAASLSITTSTPVSPAISITGNGSVCAGASASYSATINVPGSAYQWKVNGVNAGTNSASYSYTPVNGDVVTCVATTPAGSCVTAGTATSNAITMAVTPLTTPTASIAASATSVCGSTSVTFTATTNVSGSSYQWKVNGANAGTNSTAYTYTPANGDVVTCVVSMPATGCYAATSVTGSGITMTVTTPATPTVSVSAGAAGICAGSSLTLTAASNVSGVSYQWKVNGVNAGTNSSTYTYVPANGDVVSCQTTMPSTGCFTATTATSTGVTLLVNTPVAPTASITASAGTFCAGSNAGFTAATNVTSASYQWQVNGSNSATGSTFSYAPVNGDVVKCMVTIPAGACYTASGVVSNAITLSVTPLTTPVINISGPASAPVGTTVSLTASLINAPANYSIAWNRNGLLFSTTNAPATTYVKAAGTDTITATITATAGCYANGISNRIYIGNALGIVSSGRTADIQVYPSPFTLQLLVRGLLPDDAITLTEAGGRTIRFWQIAQPKTEERLTIEDVASGVYFLKVTGRDGVVRSTTRVVRE